MFSSWELSLAVERVREARVPDAVVLTAGSDFETLPSAQAEDLGLLVDSLDPLSAPAAWLPGDAPELLQRFAGGEFTVGMPGDGSVAWSRQTSPPVVVVKPRVEGSPDSFVDFLLAEALVELSVEARGARADVDEASPAPEHFLSFFGSTYPELDAVTTLGPNGTYQLANALYEGWLGLHTQDAFAAWLDAEDERAALGEAWQDAGSRLESRLADLPREVARGETEFADAAELACSGVKHGVEVPSPFAALATDTYRERGAPFAVRWAERTFDALAD
jgi:hypothetical protein